MATNKSIANKSTPVVVKSKTNTSLPPTTYNGKITDYGKSLISGGSSKVPTKSSVSSNSSSKITTPTKTPIFANPFSGGFFNNLKGGLNTLKQNTSNTLNEVKNKPSVARVAIKDSMTLPIIKNPNIQSPYIPKDNMSMVPNQSAPNMSMVPNQSLVSNQPTNTGGTTHTTTTNQDGTTTQKSVTNTPAFTPTVPVSYAGIDGTKNAIMGINEDVKALQGQGSAWSYDNGKMLINNRVGAWTDSIANNFKSTADFQNAYNTNANFKAQIDSVNQYGVTPESISAKLQSKENNNVNGILPPQTTADYLNNTVDKLAGIPKYNTGDPKMDANLREEALLTRGYTKEYIDMLKGDHDTVGVLEQDKTEAQQNIDLLNEKEANKEASVREKAQYMIDKAQHEFTKADAELELNRINAKNSMVGLLASLGALDTSGSAGLAVATLDQKYQAQRQDLRSNFDMGVREIRMNMNDNINTLQENLDDNILKINSDLSKSEREINLDIMKMIYNTNKDMLEIKMKADTALRTKLDKAEAKEQSYADNYTSNFMKLAAGGASKTDINSIINSQGNFNKNPDSLMKAIGFLSKTGNAKNFVELTPTQKTSGLQFLIKENAPADLIALFKSGDENTILNTLRLMEDNN